jgi:cytochrome c oxidase subunit 3
MPEQFAEHFEDIRKQAHAARLGMWIFLASEVLFFSGLFGLYATYRVEHPHGFGVAVAHNTIAFGSINTAILLISSYTIALAVLELRRARHRASARLIGATIVLGASFLAVKMGEYREHFKNGIYPGGTGAFYEQHREAGTSMFFTLYYCMTGLHAVHVLAGMGVLTFLLRKVVRRDIGAWAPHPLAIGAVYWHLVDVIWIFLWPLFYLTPGTVNP